MVGLKLTRGATGRSSSWETEDLEDPVNQLHIFLAALDERMRSGRFNSVREAADQIDASATVVTRLVQEIRSAPKAELKGLFYRGRPGPEEVMPDDFAPPNPQPRNRFNSDTERALYLARTDKVLRDELSQMNPNQSFWVQKFEVESSRFILLPLDPLSSSDYPSLNQLMILAERRRSDAPLDPYLGTHLLRALCLANGIHAVEYPTITGSYSKDKLAINVAVLSEDTIDQVLSARVDVPYFVSSVG